jgi:histidine kinase/DNA gyrase B/HSP90-like ATPase
VVADVIHMIAELVENATIFSPPNTPVRLTGDMVGKGFAVEIEDRGLGLNEDRLAEINDRLANPPEFDLSDSDQLGLFVAGRLAMRHGIRIGMRLNPYGGTTAIVLIPRELVVSEEMYARDPAAAQASESAVQATGRHAARSEDIIASAAGPTGAHPYANGRGRGPLPDMSESWAIPAVPAMPAIPGATDAADTSSASWFQRPGDNGWPKPESSPDADTADTADAATTADLTEVGLPRRVRQANLAPQLRQTGPQSIIGTDSEPIFRSPEEARATMTAIQQGWERGRSTSDLPGSTDNEPTADEAVAHTPVDGGEE